MVRGIYSSLISFTVVLLNHLLVSVMNPRAFLPSSITAEMTRVTNLHDVINISSTEKHLTCILSFTVC